jgi:enediyne biosynthesis protein E4
LVALLVASNFLVNSDGRQKIAAPSPQIKFSLQTLPFLLDSDETLKTPHAPATMAGGVAVFDYNRDGRPDIFSVNGANIETFEKDSPRPLSQ